MKTPSKMRVGAIVWVFQSGRRVYRRDPITGWAVGGPIWREHWVEQRVLGETRVSWLVGPPEWFGKGLGLERQGVKLKKSEGSWPNVALTLEEIDDREYVHCHAYRIGERVGRCADAVTLRAIAAMVGYVEPLPELGSGQ